MLYLLSAFLFRISLVELFSFNPEIKTTLRKGERLYGGENFERLRILKPALIRKGMFTSSEPSISVS